MLYYGASSKIQCLNQTSAKDKIDFNFKGRNCMKVYTRDQIVEIHLHFNTPGFVFFFRKNLIEKVTLLQLHCTLLSTLKVHTNKIW